MRADAAHPIRMCGDKPDNLQSPIYLRIVVGAALHQGYVLTCESTTFTGWLHVTLQDGIGTFSKTSVCAGEDARNGAVITPRLGQGCTTAVAAGWYAGTSLEQFGYCLTNSERVMDSSRLLSPLTPSTAFTFSPSENVYPKTDCAESTTEYIGSRSSDTYPLPRRPRPWWKAIGTIGSLTLCLSFIVTVAALGFLVFLWTGDKSLEGKNAPDLWRTIMLHDWATPAITFTTQVIRAAVGLQVSICTGFVAAILFERAEVTLWQVAPYSILRSVTASPADLMNLIMFGERPKRRWLSMPIILFGLMTLFFMAIQWASTILVLDLGDATLVQKVPIIQNITLGPEIGYTGKEALEGSRKKPDGGLLDPPMAQASQSDYTSRPQFFSPFGEIGSEFQLPDKNGVSETGVIQRAFIPFLNSSDRIALRDYIGYTTIFDSRVACLRPPFKSAYRMRNALAGQLDLSDLPKDHDLPRRTDKCEEDIIHSKKNCSSSFFSCSTYIRSREGRDNETTFACHLDLPLNNTAFDAPLFNLASQYSVDKSFLIFNFTGAANNDRYSNYFESNESITLTNPRGEGEWTTYDIGKNGTVTASLCFSSFVVEFSEVHLTSPTMLTEPAMSFNLDTKMWDTIQVRKRLDALQEEIGFDDRGIMRMKRLNLTKSLATNEPLYTMQLLDLVRLASSAYRQGNVSIPMCAGCHTIEDNSTLASVSGFQVHKPMHPQYSSLFQQTLQETGRPARALSAILIILAQNSYYDALSLSDARQEVTTLSAVPVRVPVRFNGLNAVACIVVVELFCVVAITALFLRRTRFSMQGNFWQVVSQIVCEETWPILEQSSDLQDKEVVHLLQQQGDGATQVSVTRSINTGRPEVVRRRNLG
ncbi:hypothetical protein JX265_003341 [Neoarthrinium moseri]|uniref:Uncharacterized protein n=1 Tax=Neoarthrinium moseri TaxID=1658444 RepID=A0A9P9WS12_9PEZI|nr:hypothetical protein JX265_003341 [Neoarthrinium moseri]